MMHCSSRQHTYTYRRRHFLKALFTLCFASTRKTFSVGLQSKRGTKISTYSILDELEAKTRTRIALCCSRYCFSAEKRREQRERERERNSFSRREKSRRGGDLSIGEFCVTYGLRSKQRIRLFAKREAHFDSNSQTVYDQPYGEIKRNFLSPGQATGSRDSAANLCMWLRL